MPSQPASAPIRSEEGLQMAIRQLWHCRKQLKVLSLGHFRVEAGCVLPTDPYQLRDNLFLGNQQVGDGYEQAVVARIDDVRDEHWRVAAPRADGQAPSFVLGHLETSGAGDGCYWVEATHLAHGGVAGVRIRFQQVRA